MEYLCGEAKATKSYNKVGLYLCYYGNANTAYFDDAQIYKEEFGESYTYDEKGNLVSAAELDQRNSTFSYDNNNLTSVIKPEGRAFSYKYDLKHNLLSGKNNSGVQNSYTHDSYGNPTSSKVEYKPNATNSAISSGKVYYIRSYLSGLYMDVYQALDVNKTQVNQFNFNGATNQRWKFVKQANGYYKLYPQNSIKTI